MSDLNYVMDRIEAGAKIRFYVDYFGSEYIEVERGWLPKRRVVLQSDQLGKVKQALRERRRRRLEKTM